MATLENGHGPEKFKEYCAQTGIAFSELDRQESEEFIIPHQISQKTESILVSTRSPKLAKGPNVGRPLTRSSLPIKPTRSGTKQEFNDEK